MALSVYKVDGKTRLIMPSSQWASSVLEKLGEMGHQVILTDEDPDLCVRDEAEIERMHYLLDSTGL